MIFRQICRASKLVRSFCFNYLATETGLEKFATEKQAYCDFFFTTLFAGGGVGGAGESRPRWGQVWG